MGTQQVGQRWADLRLTRRGGCGVTRPGSSGGRRTDRNSPRGVFRPLRAAAQDPPRTLTEVHEALVRIRPARQAPLDQWLAYFQRPRSGTPRSRRSIEVTITRRCIWPSTSGTARRRLRYRSRHSSLPMASRERGGFVKKTVVAGRCSMHLESALSDRNDRNPGPSASPVSRDSRALSLIQPRTHRQDREQPGLTGDGHLQ
jgi:hypothetical protein